MPRCGCADTCSCLVIAGQGVTVDGIGTVERPYEISSEPADLVSQLIFEDGGNVEFATSGDGTIESPYLVSASAQVKLTELIDVNDPDGENPVDGEVPVWVSDHWEFRPQTGGSGGADLPPGGSTGQVLTKASSADSDTLWATPDPTTPITPPIRGIYYRTAAFSVATGVTAAIPFETAETAAVGITYNTATGLFTVVTTGYYVINADLRVLPTAPPANCSVSLHLFKNGASYSYRQLPWVVANTTAAALVLNRQVYLTAGDTFDLRLAAAGATFALSIAAGMNSVQVVRITDGGTSGGTGGGGEAADEVVIQNGTPLASGLELWVDLSGSAASGSQLIQSGELTIVPSAGDTPTSKAVVFPIQFQATPIVVISPSTAVPGTGVKGVSTSGETSTGFDAWVTRNNTTGTIVDWIAVGKAP